jgi:hypothetical protein
MHVTPSAQKNTIESELGTLDWQELPHRRDCRIAKYRAADIDDRTQWPEQHAWLLERLQAFRRAFADRVRALELGEDNHEMDDPDNAG